MSEASEGPVPYRVVYSERVRNSLRQLVARARAAGLATQILVAVREMDRRLRLFPQFGQPLMDLGLRGGQVWIGAVGPLVIRYALYEERKLVVVAAPILPLPGSGF